MSGFTADESAGRAGLPTSDDTQSVDSTVAASGDVLLAPQTAATGTFDTAILLDALAAGAEHGSAAAAPIVTMDSEASTLTAALSSDIADDAGNSFHLSASADAFWFTLDQGESIGVIADGPASEEDQAGAASEVTTHVGSGTDPMLTAQSVGLFHDVGSVDQPDSTTAGYFGASSSSALGNTAAPIFTRF